MTVRCFNGKITNVAYAEDGSCRIDVKSFCRIKTLRVQICHEALELINYNLEEVKKINANCKLRNLDANIYFFNEGTEKLEICFNNLYSISIICKVKKLLFNFD